MKDAVVFLVKKSAISIIEELIDVLSEHNILIRIVTDVEFDKIIQGGKSE